MRPGLSPAFFVFDLKTQIKSRSPKAFSLSCRISLPSSRFCLNGWGITININALDSVFDPLREFSKDSSRLVKRCHKPDRKEFTKVAFRTAIGFMVMGFVGFLREAYLHPY